jgi:hypothetical protein
VREFKKPLTWRSHKEHRGASLLTCANKLRFDSCHERKCAMTSYFDVCCRGKRNGKFNDMNFKIRSPDDQEVRPLPIKIYLTEYSINERRSLVQHAFGTRNGIHKFWNLTRLQTSLRTATLSISFSGDSCLKSTYFSLKFIVLNWVNSLLCFSNWLNGFCDHVL